MCGGGQRIQAVGKDIRRGRQGQCFCGQAANAFAVHGEMGGARGRNHLGEASGFDGEQGFGGDRFDFRHDQVRFFLLYQRAQGCRIAHIHDMGAVCDLMARRIRITIHRDDFNAQALQSEDDFLAKLTCTEQHDTHSRRRERRP